MKTGEKRVQLIDVDCCETKLNCGFKWIYFDDDEISWKQILIEGNSRLRKQTRQYKSLEYDPTRHNKNNNNNTTSNDENISKMKNPKIFFCWFFCWINFSFVFFSLFFFRFFYKYILNLFFLFLFLFKHIFWKISNNFLFLFLFRGKLINEWRHFAFQFSQNVFVKITSFTNASLAHVSNKFLILTHKTFFILCLFLKVENKVKYFFGLNFLRKY